MDVADKYPDTTVHGIDLFPPPNTWVPPNCVLEVEDVGQGWTWKHKFDLIHMYAFDLLLIRVSMAAFELMVGC